jgi:thiosulfate/3-mercaptopyruvate sulfurtransferase
VDADCVAHHTDDANIRLVDADTTAYDRGHNPTRSAGNWFTDLNGPVRWHYIDQKGLSRLLRQAGVGPDPPSCLRREQQLVRRIPYWLCSYLGFDAVKLLDGRRKKWELDGRELTHDVPALVLDDFQVTGLVSRELLPCATRCRPSWARSS